MRKSLRTVHQSRLTCSKVAVLCFRHDLLLLIMRLCLWRIWNMVEILMIDGRLSLVHKQVFWISNCFAWCIMWFQKRGSKRTHSRQLDPLSGLRTDLEQPSDSIELLSSRMNLRADTSAQAMQNFDICKTCRKGVKFLLLKQSRQKDFTTERSPRARIAE